MKAQQLRDMSDEELQLQHDQLRQERFDLLNGFRMTKKMEQAHRLPEIRRDVARIKTILNERHRAKAQNTVG